MTRKKQISLLLCTLLSVLTMGMWTSCDKYNSESVGSKFFPANSVVRNFTHSVYVEFSQGDVRVWGAYTKEVDVSGDGQHLILTNNSDSLALVIYGFPSQNDSAALTDYSITIEGDHAYALYLNKLNLCSQKQPAIRSASNGICYLVLPKGSKNQLRSVQAPAVFEHNGELVITGEGELSLSNLVSNQHQEPALTSSAALLVCGGLLCQYNVKLTMSCPEGDAIRVSDGPIRSSLGSWNLIAGQHAISNTNDSIVLIAGEYSGIAHNGKFFDNRIGAVIRQAKVEGLSGMASDLLDTLTLHQHYDSTYVALQQHFEDISLKADSLVNISVKGSSSSIAKFTPRYQMQSPWVVIANSSLQETDTLTISL